MFILKKKHEAILKRDTFEYYNAGFEIGRKAALDRTRREVKQYKNEILENEAYIFRAYRYIKKLEEELVKNEKEIEGLRNISNIFQERLYVAEVEHEEEIKEIGKVIAGLMESNIELDKRVDILRFFLRTTYNKDVARYENIARRTKKIRIKDKAEKKIIKLKELALAFE